jgi:hypothetical protein
MGKIKNFKLFESSNLSNEIINYLNNKLKNNKIIQKIYKLSFIKKYKVEYGNENGIDNIDFFNIKEESLKEFENISFDDFDNPNSVTNYAILEEIGIDLNIFFKILNENIEDIEIEDEDDEDSIYEDVKYDLSNNIVDIINYDDSEIIEHKYFDRINDKTDSLISDVISELGYNSKYTKLNFENENGEEKTIQIRISDHSWNISNNFWNGSDFNISLVIADKDETNGKFMKIGEGNNYQIHFTSKDKIKDIVDELKEIIKYWKIENNIKIDEKKN